jgi:putative ABC transport system permease protein
VGGIILMLSASFTRLVLIAIVLAVPVVYFGMSRWLETFPYHTTIGVLTFAFAGLLALLIAFATVSYQSVKAALANPVNSLRYE